MDVTEFEAKGENCKSSNFVIKCIFCRFFEDIVLYLLRIGIKHLNTLLLLAKLNMVLSLKGADLILKNNQTDV